MSYRTFLYSGFLVILAMMFAANSAYAVGVKKTTIKKQPVTKLNTKAIKNIKQIKKLPRAEYQKKIKAHNLKVKSTAVKTKAQAKTNLAPVPSQNNKADRTKLDCDDSNPSMKPGGVEVCDGLDNNCNGDIDEGVLRTFYLDADSDLWGDERYPYYACNMPSGYVERKGDCDDTSSSIHPGARDTADNGIDENCDRAK